MASKCIHVMMGILDHYHSCWCPGTPFYCHELSLIPARISNHIASKVWDEITYPLPNFICGTVEVWEWIGNFIPHCILHYNDVIMSAMASQITSPTIVYSTVYWGTDERKLQSSSSLAFVQGIPPVTGEFPTQRASKAEKVSIWWCHHVDEITYPCWD